MKRALHSKLERLMLNSQYLADMTAHYIAQGFQVELIDIGGGYHSIYLYIEG